MQYLANYPDLQAAFGTDYAAATVHFIVHGFAEGRTDEPLPASAGPLVDRTEADFVLCSATQADSRSSDAPPP